MVNEKNVYKHKNLWEEINGKVPDGAMLKSRNGDKSDCDPSNWELKPIRVILAANRFMAQNKMPPEFLNTVIAMIEVQQKVASIRKGRK